MAAYRDDLKTYEAAKTIHDSARRKGIDDPSDAPVEPPQPRRYLTSTTITEALGVIQAHQPHRGFLRYIDEMTGLLTGMNQYKGGRGDDRQAHLSLRNRGPIAKDLTTYPSPFGWPNRPCPLPAQSNPRSSER
jgi:hypothetical protein